MLHHLSEKRNNCCNVILNYLLQGVALEGAPFGVTCNAICPGYVYTAGNYLPLLYEELWFIDLSFKDN